MGVANPDPAFSSPVRDRVERMGMALCTTEVKRSLYLLEYLLYDIVNCNTITITITKTSTKIRTTQNHQNIIKQVLQVSDDI